MKNDQQNEMTLVYHGIVYSKKNSKRIIPNSRTGRVNLISSAKALENENDMIKQFKSQTRGKKMPSPVFITFDMYEPNFVLRDLDNQATSILDALVRAGIIENDNFRHVIGYTVGLAGIDKSNPRAIIHIDHEEGVKCEARVLNYENRREKD